MRKLTLRQQIEYHLSLVQVIIDDDNRRSFYAVSLLPLTAAVGAMWPVSEWVLSGVAGLSALVSDLAGAVTVTGKLLMIGFNALAYGLGGVV